MTKKKMLNGMSESDFYSLYPTEDHYKKAMGGEMSTMQTGGEQISGLTVDEFNKAPINIENDLRYQYYNDNDSQPQSQQEITSETLNRRIQEVGRERALKELNTSFNPTQEFLSGGDVKNIMKQLIKRQEGGNGVVGSDKQATSIDTAKNNILNVFMTTVQNNTERAFAQEELQKLQGQHQMPDGSMMMGNSHTYAAYGGNLPKAQYGQPWESGFGQNMNSPTGWENPQTATNTPFTWENPTGKCSEQAKMTPGNKCYIPGYGGYSTPEGTFGAQGNQMTDAYGMMPQADPYYSTKNPFPTQGSLNLSGAPTTPAISINKDVPEEYQAPKVEQTTMTGTQRTDEPVNQTITPKPKSKQRSWSGIDNANLMLAGLNIGANFLEGIERRKQEKKQNTSFDAYGMVDTRDDRGQHDQFGRYKPDSYVSTLYAGSNYGNAGSNQYFQQGGEMNYKNGDEVYMSDSEIENYLKSGGQIEYLD